MKVHLYPESRRAVVTDSSGIETERLREYMASIRSWLLGEDGVHVLAFDESSTVVVHDG